MRIVSGKYKSFRYNLPSGFKARPTTDFAKEGLFNVLNNRIDFEDIKVLDLFSGSGSISFEFISRGAAHVTAIDKNRKNILLIKKIAEKLNEKKRLTALPKNVFSYLATAILDFDIIFADPPYDLPDIEKIPQLIFTNPSFKPETSVVIEHSQSTDLSSNLNYKETRKYGKVNFSFLGV